MSDYRYFWNTERWYSLNSRDLFLNLRRLVKMTKPLWFENKSLRLKYKCLICIWIIYWANLDLFINPKYLFQNKSFSQTYYLKSEKKFVILTSLLGLKINPGNLESSLASSSCFSYWNVFQNDINALPKIIKHFLSKPLKFRFRTITTIGFCLNFTSTWSKYVSNNVWRDFKTSDSMVT